MTVVQVAALAGAWVLALAGFTKTARPAPTHRALRTLARAVLRREARVPISLVRALGVVEIAVAALVVAADTRAAMWPLAVLYTAFAIFVVLALATGAPLASCGCFGRDDVPPTLRHLAVDAAVAALAVAGATDRSLGSARDALAAHHGLGALVSLAVAVLVAASLGAFGSLRPARVSDRR